MYIYIVDDVFPLAGSTSMLLSKQQIIVCLLLLPNLLCQKAVEDLERCVPWPGLCGSSNVSII